MCSISRLNLEVFTQLNHPKEWEFNLVHMENWFHMNYITMIGEYLEQREKIVIYILYSIYLEALHDVVANTHQDIKQDGDFTTIIDYTDTAYPLKIPEYQFLLSPICHMQNRYGSRPLMYDVHSAISDHDFKYFDVQVLRCIMFELSNWD